MKPKVLLISCTCPEPSTPSLGITSIATYLLSNGIEVKIFDDSPYMLDIADEKTDPREMMLSVKKTDSSKLYKLPYEDRIHDLIDLVNKFQPDLVGASITEVTYKNAIEYFKVIKKEIPDVKTVIGGSFPILEPEIPLKEQCIDMVSLGEGEISLFDYCTRLMSDENPLDAKGLIVKHSDGRIVKNPLPPLIDLNKLEPLRFDLYNEKRLYRPISGAIRRMLPLEVSRGCIYNCTFCASPSFKKNFNNLGNWTRYKNIETLDRDIYTYLKMYNPEYFFIISETFLAMGKDNLDKFVEMYGKYKVPFWMNTRPETVTEDNIKKLKGVGLERMSIGVECGNEEYRRTHLNRKYSNDLLINVFDILNKYDIKVTANIMIGLPDETSELIIDSIRLIKRLRPTSVGLAIFQPYKGTDMYNMVIEKGYFDDKKILDNTCYKPTIKNQYLSDDQIMKFLYTFNLRVKMDESEWNKLDEIDISKDEGMLILRDLLLQYEN